ncbi:MAG: multidrug effflux MFS transporter [Proteobacteria bacterium]|nr:multidrug effflux MFS transporter [Pseudomonadota bacterium]
MAKASSRRLIALLAALIAFGPLSIDMYLPAFPTLEREFGAAGGWVQFTLASYFIGMALGQALYGPIADHIGRKPPLYAGFLLYVLASAACGLAQSVESLVAWRFLQAVGGCAGVVIARAVVRDLYDLQTSARVLSRLMLVMGAAPILAPLIGGQILHWVGWRAIFALHALFGALCFVAVATWLPETRPTPPAGRAGIGAALRTYRSLLADREFLGFSLSGALASAGMFAYIAGSPLVMIEIYGIPAQSFGWIFGMNALGIIGASQLNHRLLSRRRSARILSVALVTMAGFGVVLLVMGASNVFGLLGVLVPLFGFVALIGLINPNATAGAMANQAARAGSASAMTGTLQFLAATVAGSLVGLFYDGTARPMVGVMAVSALGAVLANQVLVRGASGKKPEPEAGRGL